MRFIVHCEVCGEYEVDEQSFKAMLTNNLRNLMEAQKRTNPYAFVANTGTSCPRCQKIGDVTVTLKVRRVNSS